MKTDVLVIGGGLAGCATAFFLAREGVAVTLLEAHDLNGRASGANAGSIHVQIPYVEFTGLGEGWARGFAPVLSMLQAGVDLWTRIGAEIGAELSVALTGGLIVARSGAQMETIRAKAAIERAAGVPVEILGAADLRAIAPYLDGGLIGGAFCAGEGKADPLAATPAFAAAARRLGAEIRIHAPVEALEAVPGGYLVTTPAGPIRAARVVNAAGAEAGRIARMLGMDLAIEGFPLQVAVTEPVAPLVRHLVYSAAGKLTLKQMGNGTCLIGGGWPSRRVARGLAVDPASLSANMRVATAVVPALAGARIARTWPAIVNGTADWRPLIGEAPGRPGFFLALFPWMGFTAGPITGRIVADLVLGRRPGLDLGRISALAA